MSGKIKTYGAIAIVLCVLYWKYVEAPADVAQGRNYGKPMYMELDDKDRYPGMTEDYLQKETRGREMIHSKELIPFWLKLLFGIFILIVLLRVIGKIIKRAGKALTK